MHQLNKIVLAMNIRVLYSVDINSSEKNIQHILWNTAQSGNKKNVETWSWMDFEWNEVGSKAGLN